MKLKDRLASFVFHEMPLYEVCLIRIKEQVSEKGAYFVPCLLKNASTKHNKYVINQNLEHIDDISCR